jgi:hypothetical protein
VPLVHLRGVGDASNEHLYGAHSSILR